MPQVDTLPPRRERRKPQKSNGTCKKDKPTFLQDFRLPSPSQTHGAEARNGRKRKLPSEDLGDIPVTKAPPISEDSQDQTATAQEEICDPVETWILMDCWPKGFARELVKMSELPSQEPSKRRSSSIHRSELKRQRAEQGAFMKQSRRILKRSEETCQALISGEYEFVSCILYPESTL